MQRASGIELRPPDIVQRARSSEQRTAYTGECARNILHRRPDRLQHPAAKLFTTGAACSVDLTACSGRVTSYIVRRAASNVSVTSAGAPEEPLSHPDAVGWSVTRESSSAHMDTRTMSGAVAAAASSVSIE